MFTNSRSPSLFLVPLLLGLGACHKDGIDTTDTSRHFDTDGDDTGDTDTDDTQDTGFHCIATDDLVVKSQSASEGFNLETQTLTLDGGCFDDSIVVQLIDAAEGTFDVPWTSVEETLLVVAIPAGIPVGPYTMRLTRGRKTTDASYDAVSDILVSGMYQGYLHVVDMADPAAPREVAAFQPWPGDDTRWVSTPVVNYQGTRVFFVDWETEGQMGIWSAQLVDGSGLMKHSADVQPYYADLAANPMNDTLVFRACDETPDRCSIHVLTGDGERVLSEVDGIVLVNGDSTSSWGLRDPVWSPDGNRVAYLRDTACEGSTEPDCDADFYSVIMVHDITTGVGEVAWFEEGVHFWSDLAWVDDDKLSWVRTDEFDGSQQVDVLNLGTGALFQVEPPEGTWDTEWNLWGPGFTWQAWSPRREALMQQPFDTNWMVRFPVDVYDDHAEAGAGQLIAIEDPDEKIEWYDHYREFSSFGHRP
jgi:hypothetical protein